MSFSRNQFVTDLLSALGNKVPDADIIAWVEAWTIYEGGNASFNLLNTTQPYGVTSNYNAIGVKNYNSYSDGINATVITLKNGYYPHLVTALQTNSISVLGFTDNTPSPYITEELNIWGTGHSYDILNQARMLVNQMDNRSNSTFEGEATPISIISNGSFLGSVDNFLLLKNPFDIQAGSATIFGIQTIDPIEYISAFGVNISKDTTALIVRMIFLFIGIVVAWQGVKNAMV